MTARKINSLITTERKDSYELESVLGRNTFFEDFSKMLSIPDPSRAPRPNVTAQL